MPSLKQLNDRLNKKWPFHVVPFYTVTQPCYDIIAAEWRDSVRPNVIQTLTSQIKIQNLEKVDRATVIQMASTLSHIWDQERPHIVGEIMKVLEKP